MNNDFCTALTALIAGENITRPSFNGLFVHIVNDEETQTDQDRYNANPRLEKIYPNPGIQFGNSEVGFISWQIKQEDILATDWEILEVAEAIPVATE